ncbi:ShlB/FhaC/HecB family hemolysin secretion/activation protein [Acidithiobacillus sulfuriphilus]|uniref:ShlB/FhaC/HecB family hemolysin secretion/activation protein n=1 Tax=Acidithiobacillus sulfuriphilus TaxID=1867749 RepID=UPI003F63FD7C
MNYKNTPLRFSVLLAFYAGAASFAPAQAALQTPGIGQILQQLPPSAPVAPSVSAPRINIPPKAVKAPTSSQTFFVRQIDLTGNTVFPTAKLQTLVANAEGHDLTLSQLDALADRVTNYYHQHGYFLSYAYIPPQTLQNGIVHIAILEAKYGKITLHNSSRVDNGLLKAVLNPFQPGSPVALPPLQRRLILMSTIPGVLVSPATFSPGEATGTSNMGVTTTAGPLVVGNVLIDNYGNRYTGREQFGGNVMINSPLGIGDRLSLQGLGSNNGNLAYGQVGYSVPLDGFGTRLSANYSYIHYHLGDTLAQLDAHGHAWIASLYLTQPFYLTQESSFYGRLEYAHKGLNDDIGAAGILNARHINEVKAILYGNHRDNLLGGGITSYMASYTYGTLAFNNAAAEAADLVTAHTAGGFSKWMVDLSRLQSLPLNTTLFLNFQGQITNDNLDSAEQLVLGGAYLLPGYSQGATAGDSGYAVTAELRHPLPIPLPGEWQGQLLADHGHVTINQHPWTGFTGPNEASLSDVGFGAQWSYRHFVSNAVIAWNFGGHSAALINSGPMHVWWSVGWTF